MEYKDVRKKFVELSGRYDLVNQDWTDNGADFFINAGQRSLDRGADVVKSRAKNVQSIVAGTVIVKTIGLRSVNKVWAGNSTDGLIELEKVSIDDIRAEYGEQVSSIDQGTPAYYAAVGFRPYPDAVLAATWSGYYDIDDLLLADTHYTHRGIILCPPPDVAYYISIDGTFYSPELSATLAAGVWTQTMSYWSMVHPDLLLEAALLKLESFYRNTEGVKDWKNVLDMDVKTLEYDKVEEENINQMEG